MKNYIKNTWVSYVISIVLSFMLFIFEPINLYSSNLNDFWFDLELLLKPSLIMFLCAFLGLVLIINIIYFINKKVFKYYNVILFIAFLCSYIQGNYLVGNLPVLSGEVIDWNKYTIDSIISIILWVIVIVATIIICKKIKIDKYIKYSGYVSLAILAMLIVSLVSTFLTTDVLKYVKKDIIMTSTFKNINKYSNEDNFIILLLDATDSKHFANAIKNNKEFKDTLKDFTYYPDTMSMHPFTRESIPLVLTGKVYENQEDYNQFVINSMKQSELLSTLYSKDYEVNIYERELFFNDKEALKIANIVDDQSRIIYSRFIKQEIKYDLFKYLPFFVKKYSMIDTLNFKKDYLSDKEDNFDDFFVEDNRVFAHYLNNYSIEKDNRKNFKFIHLDGAHTPFSFVKDLSLSDSATYDDEVEGSLNIVDMYLKKLKNSNVYNNSKIIIMADHGYNIGSDGVGILEGRQNPILFVKGFNEVHDNMQISDKKVSFINLQKAYNEIINNKNSNEIFNEDNTTRRYLLYSYEDTSHMVEYETKDKAWETDKMYKTGKEFNLK